MDDPRVLWLIRTFGFAVAAIGYVFGERYALLTLAALLAFEWENHRRVVNRKIDALATRFEGLETRIDEPPQFAYLEEPDEIWTQAKEILEEAESRDEIWSTASWPNDPAFEEAVLRRAATAKFYYKRLLCYADDGAQGGGGHDFVAFDDNNAPGGVLEQYCIWYREFFDKWKKTLADDPSGPHSELAMKIWHNALVKLERRISDVFELKSLGSEVASDYFILLPHDKHHRMKAVVGFPLTRDGMRGGLTITLPQLAWDLLQNLKRLWFSKGASSRRVVH